MSDSASVFEQPHSRREASEMRVHLGHELERGKGQIQALSADRANLTAEREALTAGYGGITGRDRTGAWLQLIRGWMSNSPPLQRGDADRRHQFKA